MAEYIEREELMKFPIRRNHYDKEHGNEHFIYGIETVLEYVENLPTIDIDIEKQTPKKPIERYTDYDNTEAGLCPFCNEGVDEEMNFCSYCGQAIDWSDDE